MSKTTAPTSSKAIGHRFKTLSGLSSFISFMGWLLIILAALGIMGGLKAVDASEEIIGLAIMGGSVIVLVLGILTVAQGQSISCFIAIEHNTRIAANHFGDA